MVDLNEAANILMRMRIIRNNIGLNYSITTLRPELNDCLFGAGSARPAPTLLRFAHHFSNWASYKNDQGAKVKLI